MAIPPLVLRIVADSSGVKSGIAQTQAQVTGLKGTVQRNAGLIQGALVGAVVAFGVSSVKAFAEAEQAFAQTQAVIKSTGGAAGVTAEEMRDLAAAFQDTSTFADEAVLGAENLLLTFTKISGDTIPDATQAVLDMSQALGQDLKSSAIQVGKALQNPEVGLTALRRVGISFTDAQVEVIKQLDATGRSAEAQAIIIAELNREFGGSAAAAADTFAGRLEQLKNTVNDLQEEIGGELVTSLSAGVEFLQDIADVALIARDALENFSADLPGGWLDHLTGANGAPSPLDMFNPAKVLGGAENLAGNITDFFNITTEAGSNAQQDAEEAAMATGLAWENGIGRALTAVEGYGDIPGVVDDANRQVDESLVAMQEAFADTFLTIDSAEHMFGGTVNDFIQDADRMADQAVRAARNMAVLSHLPIPEAFMRWLESQGPGAIDKFVRANKAGQDKIIADWRRAEAAADKYGTAAERATRPRIAKITTSIDFRSLSMLESKLAGLEARYGVDFTSAGRTPTTPTAGGGGGTQDRKRKRDAAYLDRQRFTSDQAYDREYSGWR